MKAVILCAGKGERLKPLTLELPKPLLPIDGRPILEYNLRLLRHHGIREVFINTSYQAGKVRNCFGDGSSLGLQISYSFESKLLGTSGAIQNFKKELTEDSFVVLYGDNLTNINLSNMITHHERKLSDATIFLHRETMIDEKTTPGIVIVNDNEGIEKLVENPNDVETSEIERIPFNLRYNNAGVYVVSRKVLSLIPEGYSDFSRDIFPLTLKLRFNLQGFTENCFYRELGSLKRYVLTCEEASEGRIKEVFRDILHGE